MKVNQESTRELGAQEQWAQSLQVYNDLVRVSRTKLTYVFPPPRLYTVVLIGGRNGSARWAQGRPCGRKCPKFTSFDPDISPELSGHAGNKLVARRRQNVVKVVSPSSQDLQKVATLNIMNDSEPQGCV